MVEEELFRAKYNFRARYEDEVDVRFNQVVHLVSKKGPAQGFWKVRVGGKEGFAPTNHFEPFSLPSTANTARAIFSHHPKKITGQYLPFNKGDTIKILSQDEDGWWYGFFNDELGLFPYNYVETGTGEENVVDSFLNNVIFEDHMGLVKTLFTVLDVASNASAAATLVPIFGHRDKVMELLQESINMEVNSCATAGTLFRQNSISSQLMSTYAKIVGQEYLSNLLKPLVMKIIKSDKSYEIDPHKVPPGESRDENIQLLKQTCQAFLITIMESINTTPVGFHHICAMLQKSIKGKFDKSRRTVVGGFFFLRFVCPAIVSPEGFDVVEKGVVPADKRRGLVLVSKVIQTLSNNVRFGSKEEYMIPLNEFINDNIDNCHFILDKLAAVNRRKEIEKLQPLSEKELNEKLSALVKIIDANSKKIKEDLEARSEGRVSAILFDMIESLKNGTGGQANKKKQITVKRVETDQELRMRSATSAVNQMLLKWSKETEGDEAESDDQGVSSVSDNKDKKLNVSGTGKKETKQLAREREKEEKEKKKEMRIQAKEREKEEKKRAKEEKTLQRKRAKEEKDKPNTPKGDYEGPPLHHPALAQGYLLKKAEAGGMGKKWKKKWMILFEGESKIYYFNTEEEFGSNNDCIELQPAFSVQPVGKSKHPAGYEFKLRNNKREYYLIASTESEMKEWLAALDSRLRDMLTPADAKEQAFLKQSLMEKMDKIKAEIEQAMRQSKSSIGDDERERLQRHIEELQVTLHVLQTAVAKVDAGH